MHTLGGHGHTVESIICQADEPQVITGAHDKTVKLWDIRKGECVETLTHHKKGIRAMVAHPTENAFATAASDKIRFWKTPEGKHLRSIGDQAETVLNALALNEDNVLVSGADDGTLGFYDWSTGNCF